MTEIHITWEEFVERYNREEITPRVDVNKGHALMKSQFAPSNWRVTIKLVTWLTLLMFPTALVLFLLVRWIPVIMIVLAFMLMRAIREEGARAVIETALKVPEFYSHAVLSGTMKVFVTDGKDEI